MREERRCRGAREITGLRSWIFKFDPSTAACRTRPFSTPSKQKASGCRHSELLPSELLWDACRRTSSMALDVVGMYTFVVHNYDTYLAHGWLPGGTTQI